MSKSFTYSNFAECILLLRIYDLLAQAESYFEMFILKLIIGKRYLGTCEFVELLPIKRIRISAVAKLKDFLWLHF